MIAQNRFKDAPWYQNSYNEVISIMGLGGIGSNTAYNISRTIPCTIYLEDFDVIEEHNLGTQFFHGSYVGQNKTNGLSMTLNSFAKSSFIKPLTINKNNTINNTSSITITGFDNLEARRKYFNFWRNLQNKELFIDGRLEANFYQIFAVTPETEEQYDAMLTKEMENRDNSSDGGKCTFKQTPYVAMLIGARITQIVVNYLSKKYNKDSLYTVPYFIEEFTEIFYINIKE